MNTLRAVLSKHLKGLSYRVFIHSTSIYSRSIRVSLPLCFYISTCGDTVQIFMSEVLAMKLATRRKVSVSLPTVVEEEPKEEVKKKKGNTNKLPSDEYEELLTPKEVVLNEQGKIVLSLKRGGEYGLPRVDIRFFSTTPVYEGFTKAGVNFDLDKLPQLVSLLYDLADEAGEMKLFEEFKGD